jgi:hypothetical protein
MMAWQPWAPQALYGNPWAQTQPYPLYGNLGGIGLGYPQYIGAFSGLGNQPLWSTNPLATLSSPGFQGAYGGMAGPALGGFGQFPLGIRAVNPLTPYGGVFPGNVQFTPAPRFSFA